MGFVIYTMCVTQGQNGRDEIVCWLIAGVEGGGHGDERWPTKHYDSMKVRSLSLKCLLRIIILRKKHS